MDTEDFDMGAAVDAVSEGLALGESQEGADYGAAPADPEVEGQPPAGAESAAAEGEGAETPAWTPPESHKHLFNEQNQLRTWRPEAAAEFAKLPELVQQEILKREEDIFKGIESYKEAANFGQGLKQVLEPYLPILQQHNIRPEANIANLMQTQYTLAYGTPDQKSAVLLSIAREYGVDLMDLAVSQPHVDPQVQDLQNQLKSLQSQIAQSQQERAAAAQAEARRAIEAFAADPKNIYFEELANDIAQLLRTGNETIESAYQKAMWMNPSVRAKELSRQQAERAQADQKAAAERAAAAKQATAANVRSQARGGSAAAPLGSMDDTLQAALADIRSRA